jgi:hypothetical protein
MKSVVGVFRAVEQAKQACRKLPGEGIAEDNINLLAPGDAGQLEQVPVEASEQPGMGPALGGVVGGAIGAAAGLGGGAAVASLLVPGVGPVMAIGFAATALLGLGGAAIGAKAGDVLENRDTHGLPEDEMFIYEDALRRGRSVVVVLAADSDAAERARKVLTEAGAETLDAAREDWWLGLRDVEREHYNAGGGGEFHRDEPSYRRGFEAALVNRGRALDEGSPQWRGRYSDGSDDPSFRAGYERGCAHCRSLREDPPSRAA